MALQISHAAGLMWISGEDSKEKKKKKMGEKSLLKKSPFNTLLETKI